MCGLFFSPTDWFAHEVVFAVVPESVVILMVALW